MLIKQKILKLIAKVKNVFYNDPDRVLSFAMFAISLIAIIIAIIFWALNYDKTVVLVSLFACAVSAYGIFINIKRDDF